MPARTDACTDNGPHGGPLGAVVDVDRAPSASPTITKAPTPDDDDEAAWCDFLGKKTAPGGGRTRGCFGAPAALLLARRCAPGLRCVCAAAAATPKSRTPGRVRARQSAGARPGRIGSRAPVGNESLWYDTCLPSARSLIHRRDRPSGGRRPYGSGCEALASQASCCSRATREQCSKVLRASCILK